MSFRRIEQSAFGVGERLVYDVGYSFFTAGEAVFAIPSMDTVHGRTAFRIQFTVNSTPSFSWIYRVEDKYETIVDESGLFPWRFTQRIREGGYERDFEAVFDHFRGVARTKDGEYAIPPHVQDVVSALYLSRTFDFGHMRPGQRTELTNFYKDSAYTLAVRFLGFQKVSVDAGTFDCFLIEPLIKEGGLFKSDGRILIWLSNDERRIPVKVSTKVAVGSIEAELREYSGLRGPLKARIK
ncbi:MAG: DUF3108 domain-containing protein [Bacteroidota bacterium]